MKCHKSQREYIYLNYTISVVGCIKLYDGTTIKSDAGGPHISDKYYQFSCKHKTTGKIETIFVGHKVAHEICDRCSLDFPKMFDPFYNPSSGGKGGGGARSRVSDPTRRELYNAIMLIITRYRMSDRNGTSVIFDILNKVTDNMFVPIEPRYVKSINTVLKRYKPLKEIINDLSAYHRVRDFRFNHLVECLHNNGEADASNFEL
ncbi:MAG: hypothetical protein E7272_01960 [Pseudobutyrivibrio ruminis]|uniref:Uncharacterized protein n=1 Tax=Pseudobutyrivibrio ruminis TaxID=46206 RepID=A0A927YLA2_9FIRM|nr:hypothetical protein [Pseudobutyrivibrio ruminis]